MTLTKREALERCRDQWAWMADTGGDKNDYFESLNIEWPHRPACGCYACEYTNSIFGRCDKCPLNGYAWEDESCTSTGSVYQKWEEAEDREDVEGMKKHAKMMVYACEWALSELEDGE